MNMTLSYSGRVSTAASWCQM